MTEIDNLIPFSGIDPRGRIKFSVLLEMFQEMADIDASKFGLSVRQTLAHNITWVLRKYRIDLARYPVKEDCSIRIKTYAEPFRNLFITDPAHPDYDEEAARDGHDRPADLARAIAFASKFKL